jgi:apolipoprotein N-acyltransferase
MQRIRQGIRWALVPVLATAQSVATYVMAEAQDAQLDVNINTNGGTAWYQQWWVWVLVGLFVLIVIVALTSRGRAAKS